MKLTAKQLAQILVQASRGKSGASLEETTVAFVEFLAQRHETGRSREIIRALDLVWREQYGAANVSVATAQPLTADLREKIMGLFRGADLQEIVEPSLIGGARLRVDDHLIDGSVAGQLAALSRALKS